MPTVVPGLVAPVLHRCLMVLGLGWIQQPWGGSSSPGRLGWLRMGGTVALGCPGSFSAGAVEGGMELLERTWGQDHSHVVVMPGTILIPTTTALSWGSPHPRRWIQPQDVFLSLCPASRQECAGSSSQPCWPCLASLMAPWHPSQPPLASLTGPPGIPHTLSILVMPLAWALPSGGLGTGFWGCISHPCSHSGGTSCTPLPVLPHLPAPLPSLAPSTCLCPGQAVAPLAAPAPPSPRPQPRGCRNACLESHAGLGLPGNWET